MTPVNYRINQHQFNNHHRFLSRLQRRTQKMSNWYMRLYAPAVFQRRTAHTCHWFHNGRAGWKATLSLYLKFTITIYGYLAAYNTNPAYVFNVYTVFQKNTSTHIIGYKLRNSCPIVIIFDITIPHIIW